MTLVGHAVRRPVAVLSAVLMIVLLGWLSLFTIPIQLTPDVRKPRINVSTTWRGAAPGEVEREIVNRQEEALKGLDGLERMESIARRGRARIAMDFSPTANREESLLLINNRLSQIDDLPDEAGEPRIITRDTDDNPIAWFVVKTKDGNKKSIFTYGDFVNDVVQDRLERIEGVALVNVWGADERELRVVVTPQTLAHYRLTIPELASKLRGTSVNISAGDLDEGKRQYTVRTESELNTLERVRDVVLRSNRDPTTGRISRVTIGDIAKITFGFKKPSSRIRHLGENSIVVNAVRDTGANVIEVMERIKKAVAELNGQALPQVGLRLEQVYDETIYINSAINLVNQNIWVGGLLAAMILLIFLRSIRATLVVTLAIPVSIVGSFVAMAALGRSINVVSLVGIAFAVGMVVDAAIVVLENIFRHREMGHSRFNAAIKGASQVWGAILVSALTTVVVFAPILVMELVVGQLFRDIAVALSVAVLLSLVVSITVVPALANNLLSAGAQDAASRFRLPLIDGFARGFVNFVSAFTDWVLRRRLAALGVVLAVSGIAGLATWAFLPKLEYLPEGNRNLVIAVTSPPPGYNLKTMEELATEVEDGTRAYWRTGKPSDMDPDGPPIIDRFWFVARPGRTIIAAAAVDPTRGRELVPIVRDAVFSEPGTNGFVRQTSVFGRGFSGSRVVDLDISGPDLNKLLEIGREAKRIVEGAMPRSEGNQIRTKPALELGAPEVRVIPNILKLADIGMTSRDLALTIDAFNDGLRVTEVNLGSKRRDLTLMGPEGLITRTQGIGNLPVATPGGLILPASALAEIRMTSGPDQIQHLERNRTVTVQVRPAQDVPLQTAIETVKNQIIAPMTQRGLPPGVRLSLSGTADDLSRTWDAMLVNLIVAILVVYLVMAILFESFVYPLIIMFSVPLATAGGVAGLVILNLFSTQALDMLTLLGFVILIGTVVNNAILIVHQTLYLAREEGLDPVEAIRSATRNRIRPIFMSTLTSVFGMIPLVVIAGAGSELYRGLGSVVVGGLALSAVLTLLIIPPLLSLVLAPLETRRARRRGAVAVAPAE